MTQIFTENIVSQLKIVENVQKSAVETNSNLTMGNENITEVCKNERNAKFIEFFHILILFHLELVRFEQKKFD